MKKIAINNGFLVDPKNRVYSKLNLLIENGKISDISEDTFSAEINIDANNLIVSPGFVDIHMHEDPFIEESDVFENTIFSSMLQMGVTTAVGGNCGIGPTKVEDYISAVNRIGIPINLGLLVPHEALRNHIGARNKYSPVTKSEIEKMAQYAEELLALGLLGLSFGIRYIPGITEEELLGIVKTCKDIDKVISAHIRDDAANFMTALDEFIGIVDNFDSFASKFEVSHIGSMAGYGQMKEALEHIDSKRLHGVNIGIDCYPYNAFSTKIGETTFDDGFLERYNINYDSIEIAEGKYRGQRCTEAIFKELRENHPNTMAIGHVMDEKDIDMALSHPNVALASDGILSNGQGHPRAAGSFPRFISEYVKKKELFSLYEAIRKMTTLPASIMNLDKGHLSIGADADITIFNYNTIKDRATFENPLEKPDGIEYVFVGGELALKHKEILRNNLGRLVNS